MVKTLKVFVSVPAQGCGVYTGYDIQPQLVIMLF